MDIYFGNLKKNQMFRHNKILCVKLEGNSAMTEKGKKITLDKKEIVKTSPQSVQIFVGENNGIQSNCWSRSRSIFRRFATGMLRTKKRSGNGGVVFYRNCPR